MKVLSVDNANILVKWFKAISKNVNKEIVQNDKIKHFNL